MPSLIRRLLLPGLVTVGMLLGGCGSASSGAGGASSSAGLQGQTLHPAKPAPPLALRNYTGRPVALSALRGKAVFVTFVYTHCPNWCPLIVANLGAAQRQLGPEASQVQVLAVTVDPRRDTPAAIRAFLSARDALGRMDYLIGPRRQMLPVWRAWDVGVTVDTNKVLAGHTALVYGITASGRIAAIYTSDFTPEQIVHDAPLLARS